MKDKVAGYFLLMLTLILGSALVSAALELWTLRALGLIR